MIVTEDRKLLIAVGRSRKAVSWQNKEYLWSELLDKLASTTRTRETVAEFAHLPKSERDTIKDIGGFVGGYLRNGKRNNASIVNRCLVCLDCDNGDAELRSDLELSFPYTYALYSTHSHTPEKPRYRVVIPLNRDVTPDEYAAISRRLADMLTLSRFDPTTFEAARLMYWPSTPEDGEFVFDYVPGKFVNADEVLGTYADWHDASLWPTTAPIETHVGKTLGKAEDPLEKRGVVGAFCRAHSISNLMEGILKNRYNPTPLENRYTYVDGTSTGGLVVYDDKFAFSHHATDPASGKLCNAFDLVRWHLFAPGSTGPDGKTIKDEKASVAAMADYATKDPATKLQLAADRKAEINLDFSILPGTSKKNNNNGGTPVTDEPSAEPASNTSVPLTEEEIEQQIMAIKSHLEVDKSGEVKNTLNNLLLILRNDPRLKGISYNALSDGIEIRDEIAQVPWEHPGKFWRDADDSQLVTYITGEYGNFSERTFDVALTTVADERSYHPIREYLAHLPPWDGVPRVETLLIDYLGSPDNAYVRTVTRKTLVGAVRRIEEPGCKHDSMLVFSGPQGIGKSTLVTRLGGEWFSDSFSLSDLGLGKTAPEKLQGYWILEISELAGLKKTEVETLRSFLSRQVDIYRAAFAKRPTKHPRQCIFFGTTNEQGFLRDTTGNRRFWPVETPGGGTKHSWELKKSDIDQIWAEAVYLYNDGEEPVLDEEIEALAKAAQRNAMETDDREGLIVEYLDKLIPDDWMKMDINARRGFLRDDPFLGGDKKGTILRNSISVIEVWVECFGREPSAIRKSDRNEILSILAKIGWKNGPAVNQRTPYGVQKCFFRPSN